MVYLVKNWFQKLNFQFKLLNIKSAVVTYNFFLLWFYSGKNSDAWQNLQPQFWVVCFKVHHSLKNKIYLIEEKDQKNQENGE